MNKLEKIMYAIWWFACGIMLLGIIWFITMFIMLVRYKDCYNNNFELPYCEKYKDF